MTDAKLAALKAEILQELADAIGGAREGADGKWDESDWFDSVEQYLRARAAPPREAARPLPAESPARERRPNPPGSGNTAAAPLPEDAAGRGDVEYWRAMVADLARRTDRLEAENAAQKRALSLADGVASYAERICIVEATSTVQSRRELPRLINLLGHASRSYEKERRR